MMDKTFQFLWGLAAFIFLCPNIYGQAMEDVSLLDFCDFYYDNGAGSLRTCCPDYEESVVIAKLYNSLNIYFSKHGEFPFCLERESVSWFFTGMDDWRFDFKHFYYSDGGIWVRETKDSDGEYFYFNIVQDKSMNAKESVFYCSNNGGRDWFPLKNALPNDMVVHHIGKIGGKLLVSGSEGLFVNEDIFRGAWVNISEGIPDADISVVYVFDDWIFAGGSTGGVYRSNDLGTSWQKIEICGSGVLKDMVKYGNKTFFIVGDEFCVQDSGSVRFYPEFLDEKEILCIENYGDTLIVGTGDGLRFSVDGGRSWEAKYGMGRINDIRLGQDVIYCFTDDGMIYYSEDWGVSWMDVEYPYLSAPSCVYDMQYSDYGTLFCTDYGVHEIYKIKGREYWSSLYDFKNENIFLNQFVEIRGFLIGLARSR